MNSVSKAAQRLGRARSEAKSAAARRNGQRGGRPPKPRVSAEEVYRAIEAGPWPVYVWADGEITATERSDVKASLIFVTGGRSLETIAQLLCAAGFVVNH